MKTKNIHYEGKLTCKLCGETFSHLGSHIYHKHKMLSKDYKERFGLPFNEALISQEIYEKKVVAFDKDRDKYLKNIMKDNGHRFVKGDSHSGIKRISESARKRFIKRINEINEKRKPEHCPVCNIIYDNVDSHLFNKHRLIKAKNVYDDYKE
jgi:hypothetical protein